MPMPLVLVAGATGALGRYVVPALKRRGYRVRALSRSVERARVLAGQADEVRVADATRRETLAGLCDGVDVVFSCLGQSVGVAGGRGPGYRAVDYVGNHRLLELARAAGVRRFVYVSVFGAERYPDVAYLRAHADVAAELRRSGLEYGIVQPTGYFSAYAAFLGMARAGRAAVIGDGRARTNPIDDAELAEVCADTVARAECVEVPVGGPAVYTRREVIELACAALGRPARIRTVPAGLVWAAARLMQPLAPRLGELAEFFGVVATQDFVAPSYGARRLDEYFASLAR